MTTVWNPDIKPEQAVKYFKRKGLKASFAWQDMWQEEHDAAFTVAKMMDVDLLRDMKEAVDAAIANGSTFRDFQKQVQPELMKRGWWGRADMTDPATGEVKNVQLGSVRRLETIFRTNMQTSYAAGDWEQITDTADDAPYLMYDAIDDNRTRPQHKAWDGTVLRFDDAWWQSHRPPNGWNCRCSTIQLSSADVKAMGLKVDPVAPPVLTREYTNKRSGEVSRVPLGIDPGFAYNPGAASLRSHAVQLFGEKVAAVPAAMGATAWASLIAAKPSVMRALDDAWRVMVDDTFAAGFNQQRSMIVGAMSVDDVAYLAALDAPIVPVSAEIAAPDALAAGAKRERHAARTEAAIKKGTKPNELSADEVRRIPAIIRSPEAVLFDTVKRQLLYVASSSTDARKSKLVVQPNVLVDRPKRTLNHIDTAFKVQRDALDDRTRYMVVRGDLK